MIRRSKSLDRISTSMRTGSITKTVYLSAHGMIRCWRTTLYPSLPHSLAFLTTAYTEHPYYKDEKDDWRAVGSMNGFWEYNVKDCCITRKAMRGDHTRSYVDRS